ncbi:MAG: hypothetical protein EOO89_23015 [Pedobacter sp.]|nr:MAG: hypothetical protein EOO89_23015 [Pedobacter sp.]
MDDLKLLSINDLLDLLIEQTSYHIHILAVGASPEIFRNSSNFLHELQQEIRLRNNAMREKELQMNSFN